MLAHKASIIKYINAYRNKADVLRVIHSRKSESKQKWDRGYTVLTLVLGALLTFSGFMGPSRIVDLFSSHENLKHTESGVFHEKTEVSHAADSAGSLRPSVGTRNTDHETLDAYMVSQKKQAYFDLIFNFSVLSLFIISLLNLIFRWKEESVVHFNGVVKLTHFINWLDEIKLIGFVSLDRDEIKKIRGKYQVIVESLPLNTDGDYHAAKRAMGERRSGNRVAEDQYRYLDPDIVFVLNVIESSPVVMRLLVAMRSVSSGLWLGGGAVRSLVWDALTGLCTKVDDFDIIYFDERNLSWQEDIDISEKIQGILPGVINISVKNQARMHLTNGEEQMSSLLLAVSNWPETATALAIRLDENDQFDLILPYGVRDLLDMIVRPTPYHAIHKSAFDRRRAAKAWDKIWPEIRYL